MASSVQIRVTQPDIQAEWRLPPPATTTTMSSGEAQMGEGVGVGLVDPVGPHSVAVVGLVYIQHKRQVGITRTGHSSVSSVTASPGAGDSDSRIAYRCFGAGQMPAPPSRVRWASPVPLDAESLKTLESLPGKTGGPLINGSTERER